MFFNQQKVGLIAPKTTISINNINCKITLPAHCFSVPLHLKKKG
jgi:hypothetical protein